jgi:hypothetical protein
LEFPSRAAPGDICPIGRLSWVMASSRLVVSRVISTFVLTNGCSIQSRAAAWLFRIIELDGQDYDFFATAVVNSKSILLFELAESHGLPPNVSSKQTEGSSCVAL